MSLAAIGAIGTIGVLTTNATFTDQVTMASVSVAGGTLDLTANGGDGPNQAWTGDLSAAVTGMAPGDTKDGVVDIKNNGTVPMKVNVSTTGTDADGCFGYYFRQTDAGGLDLTSMGTDATSDAGVVPLATAVTDTNLPIPPATTTWPAGTQQEYTLTVRMLSTCTTNGAAGTLDFTFNATSDLT